MRALFYISQVTVLWVVYATALNDTTTNSLIVTTPDGSYCHDQWVRYGQSCYLRATNQLDFSQANVSCPENGHLVSISDEEENNFLMSLSDSTETAWIGLFRKGDVCFNHSSCDWMWADGSEMPFTKWPTGGAPGVAKCGIFRSTGIWGNDQFCNTRLDFICKRRVWFLTTTPEVTTTMTTEVVPDRSTTMVSTHRSVESKETRDDDDDDMPIIIGCVVGGLVLIAIITVVAIVLLKRHRTSRPTDQSVEVKDEETPADAKQVRYNPGYEDVDLVKTQGETNVTFKPSPGNADTGAHGVGDNPHNIYSEAIKQKDRPGSKGILVKENTLYGTGK